MSRLFSLYGGSAGVVRHAAGIPGLITFMGRKDRLAAEILSALGWGGGAKFWINDPGLWGRVWEALSEGRAADICAVLDGWQPEDRVALWERLSATPPMGGPEGCAQFLYLQGRSIRGVPLYFCEGENQWVSHRPNGTLKLAAQRQPPRADGSGGGITAAGIAKRLRKIAACWKGVQVSKVKAEVFDMDNVRAGDTVYLDPPYLGKTPYQVTTDRAAVVRLARESVSQGAVVGISEAGPLDIPGCTCSHYNLTAAGHGFPEWLTVVRALNGLRSEAPR